MINKKLNIGLDASFVHGENSGTGEYTKNLIKHLSQLDKINTYTLFPFFTYIYNNNFKSYRPQLPENFHIFWNKVPKKIIDIIWNKLYFLRSLYFPYFDIFHSTTFTMPQLFSYDKLIFTVYDVSFYTHPQFHMKENIRHCLNGLREAIKKADAIIAISHHTKKDLIKYFDCPENKIFVTHLACDSKFYKKINESNRRKILTKYKINKQFIFHLGSIEPRKNTMGLIKAYQFLPKKLQDKYDLVIGGGKGWLNDPIYNYVRKHNLSINIKIIGYVSNKDLPSLYQSAKCFVYPSFYEGFGIPPLEAMASGCPVLVSNTSSMPEICQESASYCVPNDIEDIKNKLQYLLENNNKILIRKGLNQVKNFSWRRTAIETLKIYKNLC
ncbi:MAG: glycosyltransferase family 1 protein [Patescibacteria group bacterium]